MYGVVSFYPIRVFKNLLKNRLFATDFAYVGFSCFGCIVLSKAQIKRLNQRKMRVLIFSEISEKLRSINLWNEQ